MDHLEATRGVIARGATDLIGESDFEVCLVRATLAPSAGRLAEQLVAPSLLSSSSSAPNHDGKERLKQVEETAQNVATYLASRRPDAIGILTEKVKKLRIDGFEWEIKLGYNIFESAADRLAAGAPP